MSLKGKIPPELKIQAVEDYQATRKGSTEIIKAIEISRHAERGRKLIWLRKKNYRRRKSVHMQAVIRRKKSKRFKR